MISIARLEPREKGKFQAENENFHHSNLIFKFDWIFVGSRSTTGNISIIN